MVTSGITSYTHLPVFVLASPEGTDIIGSLFICLSAIALAVSCCVGPAELNSDLQPGDQGDRRSSATALLH